MQTFIKSGGLVITPPQEEPPVSHLMYIGSLSDYTKGRSIKPGNIKLNIRHLIEFLPRNDRGCRRKLQWTFRF